MCLRRRKVAKRACVPRPQNTHQSLPLKVVEKDAAQKGYPHSYIEKLWDDMYFEGRWSLPINSNPYLALKPPPEHAVSAASSEDAQIMGATRWVPAWAGRAIFLRRSLVFCRHPLRTQHGLAAKQAWKERLGHLVGLD